MLSEKLFHSVAGYIDQNYVDRWEKATYGPEGNTYRQQMSRQADYAYNRPMPPMETATYACTAAPSLEDMLKQEDAGFTETLLKLIDRSGRKDSAVYHRANLSKQHFSKIRNNPNYRPTKATAIALAMALELDLEQTRDLIGRAGYALTNSSKFDLIIRYFIERKNFDVMQINMTLYEFDQPLLGG